VGTVDRRRTRAPGATSVPAGRQRVTPNARPASRPLCLRKTGSLYDLSVVRRLALSGMLSTPLRVRLCPRRASKQRHALAGGQ